MRNFISYFVLLIIVLSITLLSSCGNEGNTVKDIDGNKYEVVYIGDQYWMKENLKVTHYPNGDAIPKITSDELWADLRNRITDDSYCYYKNDKNNVYGCFYTYAAAIANNWQRDNKYGQGICPDGWHLPTIAEWRSLEDWLLTNGHSGTEGTALKSVDGWEENGNGTDDYGFTALPAGYRSSYDGSFEDAGLGSCWWSATADYDDSAEGIYLFSDKTYLHREDEDMSNGFLVRCIKNN